MCHAIRVLSWFGKCFYLRCLRLACIQIALRNMLLLIMLFQWINSKKPQHRFKLREMIASVDFGQA